MMDDAAGRGELAGEGGGILDGHRDESIEAPTAGVQARALKRHPEALVVSLGPPPGSGAPIFGRSGKSIKSVVLGDYCYTIELYCLFL